MNKDLSEQAIEKILGSTPTWVVQFDVYDYLGNRPMIEKLYEEKQLTLAKLKFLEAEVLRLKEAEHKLQLSEQRLKDKTSRSQWSFGISLIATITAAIGVNIVTSPTDWIWIGWFLIGLSALLEVMSFRLTNSTE